MPVSSVPPTVFSAATSILATATSAASAFLLSPAAAFFFGYQFSPAFSVLHQRMVNFILYGFLDESAMFNATVNAKEDRSLMNIPFVIGDKDLEDKFVKEAKAAGFENLKGHRTVGGMRASIYNAMPYEGVEALIEFMKKFAAENK